MFRPLKTLCILLPLSLLMGAQNQGPATSEAVNIIYTHVQGCGYNLVSPSTSTVACTFSNAVTPGNMIYISATSLWNPFSGVTFSGESGTFTPELTNVNVASGSFYYSTWHLLSAVGGGTTITLNTTGSSAYPSISIDEWNCNPGPCTYDKSDAGNVVTSGLSATQVSLSITPTNSYELIIGSSAQCCNGGYTYAATSGSGFILTALSGGPTANEWQIQTISAPITAAFTANSAPPNGSVTHVAAFK